LTEIISLYPKKSNEVVEFKIKMKKMSKSGKSVMCTLKKNNTESKLYHSHNGTDAGSVGKTPSINSKLGAVDENVEFDNSTMMSKYSVVAAKMRF
jgi:hypothetical protein